DVEGRHAIAEFGGVVEHLTHADKCHEFPVSRWGSLIVCKPAAAADSVQALKTATSCKPAINSPGGTLESTCSVPRGLLLPYCALQSRPIRSSSATQYSKPCSP